MTKQMWSPWRSAYVERKTQETEAGANRSVFSRAAEAEQDEEHLVLWRGQHVFVIMNLHPYNNGHLLIVPFREVARYEALTAQEQAAIAQAIDRCIRWLRHALEPEGFNVGMNLGKAAGAGIPEHLHVHVVPRWAGDTNFTATTADLKVIPEAMQTTYRKLRATVEALGEDAAQGRDVS